MSTSKFSETLQKPKNEIWKFSDSSQMVKNEFLNLVKMEESEWGNAFKERQVVPKKDIIVSTYENILNYVDFQRYNEVIATTLPKRFAEIVKECDKDAYLLPILVSFIEMENSLKLIRYSLLQEKLPPQYSLVVYTKILSYMSERVTPKNSLDLLKAAFMWSSDLFLRHTIPAMLLDDICEEPLLNFVKNLGKNNKNKVMVSVAKYPLNTDRFMKHLQTVYELYRDCEKTMQIQEYIRESLLLFSDLCCSDKTYGRLLLSYLQSAGKDGFIIDFCVLKVLVKNHQTIFKKACEAALRSYKNYSSGDSN